MNPRDIQRRAGDRCEYCKMHQSLQGGTFHIEHIVPVSAGGGSESENLAWACPACNLRKSNRVDAIDPVTGDAVPLFNPRTDQWDKHFRFVGHQVEGLTPQGRSTIRLLDFNHARRQLIRSAERRFGLFPP